jgi:hypothetical protein
MWGDYAQSSRSRTGDWRPGWPTNQHIILAEAFEPFQDHYAGRGVHTCAQGRNVHRLRRAVVDEIEPFVAVDRRQLGGQLPPMHRRYLGVGDGPA